MINTSLHAISTQMLILLLACLPLELSAYSKIQMFSGFSHFAWLQKLQESPDNIQSWENDKPSDIINAKMRVSYPKQTDAELLITKSEKTGGGHSLQLASLTSFSLNSDTDYFGFHHVNTGGMDQDIILLFTLNDGSVEEHRVRSANHGRAGFVGFLLEGDSTIRQVDIDVSDDAKLSIDNIQWGRLPVLQNNDEPNEDVISKEELSVFPVKMGCNIKPELVRLQCDNQRWLFDVKVSGNNAIGSWWCSDDEEEQCDTYDKTISYHAYPTQADDSVTIVFTDQQDRDCVSALNVSLSGVCKKGCSYQYNDGNVEGVCEEEGTLLVEAIDKSAPSFSILAKVNSLADKNTVMFDQLTQRPPLHSQNRVIRSLLSRQR